jgi:small subunit ribosomal protein S17e
VLLLPSVIGMGRIKTQQIKSKGNDLFAANRSSWTGDFAQNKQAVTKAATVRSKKLRNVLAGFLTRKAKRAKQLGE